MPGAAKVMHPVCAGLRHLCVPRTAAERCSRTAFWMLLVLTGHKWSGLKVIGQALVRFMKIIKFEEKKGDSLVI